MDTKYHDLSCIAMSIPFFAVSYLISEPQVAIVGIGSLSGLFFSPDLDWNGDLVFNSYTNSTYIVTRPMAAQEHRKKKVFGKISRRWLPPLQQWWELYALILPHRSLSHVPIAGTLTRLVWMFPVFLLFLYFFPFYFAEFVCGLVLVDIMHWLMDSRP